MPKKDEFMFLGFNDRGWFSQNFAGYSLFGYVGDRERLQEAIQQNRSIIRKVLAIVLPSLKITSLLEVVTGFDLPKVATDSGLAKQLFDLLAQEENRRTIYEQLTALQRKAQKDGRFFQKVARDEYQKDAALSAPALKLEDKLVTVEGQLVHREAVQQHSKTFAATLRASKHEWLLCDYPPHALNERNSRFKGGGLLLREDTGFSEAFGRFLPFCTQIGWYPYVRVTGFYSSAKVNTEKLPSLSIALVEFRPPKNYLELRPELLSFGCNELDRLSYLDDWSDLLLFSYVPALVLAGSNLTPSDVDIEIAALLRKYAAKAASDLPVALVSFYDSVPIARDA